MNKAETVKAIMNNKNVGLPDAVRIYKELDPEERKAEWMKYNKSLTKYVKSMKGR